MPARTAGGSRPDGWHDWPGGGPLTGQTVDAGRRHSPYLAALKGADVAVTHIVRQHQDDVRHKIRKWRAEAALEGPFDVTASASDAADIPAYRRLEGAGVTHVLTMPWAFYHGLTNDLEKQCDGIRRFAEDVIRELS